MLVGVGVSVAATGVAVGATGVAVGGGGVGVGVRVDVGVGSSGHTEPPAASGRPAGQAAGVGVGEGALTVMLTRSSAGGALPRSAITLAV